MAVTTVVLDRGDMTVFQIESVVKYTALPNTTDPVEGS